jgi:hypothetical protein
LRRAFILIIVIVIVVGLLAFETYPRRVEEFFPVIHSPTFPGKILYILGSGNVVQNGSAYSYVRINASAIRSGDSFTVFPAINVPLTGVNEINFTATITYRGSSLGSSPYWLNFSVIITNFHFTANTSQNGIAENFTRSAFPLPSQNGAEYFSQISNVVNAYNEFEYFFYIGNSSTPSPQLTHGPVR